jgi:hypothetical protein
MRWIPLFFLAVSFNSWAKERTTYKSLTDLMEISRDTVFTSKQRIEYLDFTRKMMARRLSQDLQVRETELSISFLKNPAHSAVLMEDPWYDLQTQFYTTLHQETFHRRWQALQNLVKFTDYGKSINSTMMAHLGNYSPVDEGRFYLRWNQVNLKADGKIKTFNVPYFLMSDNVNDLVEMEAHVPFDELVPKKDVNEFINRTAKLTRTEKQELSEKMELNRRIYLRAIANAAKTIGTIHHLTGILTRPLTKRKITEFIDSNCENCTNSEKWQQQTGALNYIDNIAKSISPKKPEIIASDFCSSLRKNNYYWNVDKLRPTPGELLRDSTKLVNYYTAHKLKDKNKTAMAKTLLEHDFGILFLTNAMNYLDKGKEPIATRLRCTSSSQKDDTKIVLDSIDEAEKNVAVYLARLNQMIRESRFDVLETNRTLDYLVQTNQAASIEATTSFPQGIGWVLQTIVELDKNMDRRQKTDKIVTWGGLIIGVGLTITGIAAPEGVALLISSAGLIKSVSAGSYYYVRSQQEKNFSKDMRLAKNGGSGLSDENLMGHYKKYKNLKISYIKEFASSALSFVSLYRLALQNTGGNIEKTNNILDIVVKSAKKTGKEQAIEQLEEIVLEMALSS